MKKEEKLKKVKGYHTEDSRKDSEMIYPKYAIRSGIIAERKEIVCSVMTILRKKYKDKWHLHQVRLQSVIKYKKPLSKKELEVQCKLVELELLQNLHTQMYNILILAKPIHLEGKGYGIETPYDKDQRSEEVRLRSTFPYLKK